MKIQIKDLSFQFKNNIIFQNLNYTFQENKIYVLVGPSGVGKSTFLDLLTKSLTPSQGEVIYHGFSAQEVMTVFQNNQLFPWLKVIDALRLPLKIQKVAKEQQITKVQTLLEDLNLTPLAEQKVATLSGGQAQRVAIGQGLVVKPSFLCLDEPTSSLDMESKEEIQRLILQEQKKHGNTLFIVTHDIEEAAFLGDEILLIRNQQIHPLTNPTKTLRERRDSLDFYEFCIQLRKEVRRR